MSNDYQIGTGAKLISVMPINVSVSVPFAATDYTGNPPLYISKGPDLKLGFRFASAPSNNQYISWCVIGYN